MRLFICTVSGKNSCTSHRSWCRAVLLIVRHLPEASVCQSDVYLLAVFVKGVCYGSGAYFSYFYMKSLAEM